MRSGLALVAILLALALLPSAAADAFVSDRIVMSGQTAVDAGGASLFVPAGDATVAWEAVASSVLIERRYSNVTEVDPVVGVVGDDPQRMVIETTHAFGPARLTSTTTRDLAALFATGGSGAPTLTGRSIGFLDAAVAQDPRVQQDPVVLQAGFEGDVHYGVDAQLEGAYVNLSSTQGTYELRGTLVIQIFDVDYVLTDGDGTTSWQTGEYAVGGTGPVRQSRAEIHTLTLADAVLVVRADSAAQVFAPEPRLFVEGTLRAHGLGEMPTLEGTTFTPTVDGGEWRGATTLTIRPDGAALVVGTGGDDSLSQGRAALRAADAPLGTLVGASLALLALAVAAAVALRRARRGEASLEAALLAMEERRWDVALSHLDRLIARSPTDPVLLVDRAICCEETGQLDEARASIEAALVEAPGNAEAHYYYARVLARLRMSTACLAHLQRALALDDRLVELARREQAFRAFHDHPQFLRLLGA